LQPDSHSHLRGPDGLLSTSGGLSPSPILASIAAMLHLGDTRRWRAIGWDSMLWKRAGGEKSAPIASGGLIVELTTLRAGKPPFIAPA
jgi:hypothetical protein